jgi:N-methylhydantoinase B
MNPAELNIFASRLDAVCEEMGLVLRNTAFSPNIRDRLDFSCAIFDAQGELCAQAAHIPVHLGSMAYAMRDVVSGIEWAEGDQVVFNDPYLGGTHLPDVTLVAPLFHDGELQAFLVNRAHHADIGAATPGSMPISHTLHDEGLLIPPGHLQRQGQVDSGFFQRLQQATRNPSESAGDFNAQMAANRAGLKALHKVIAQYGAQGYAQGLTELNDYAERLARDALAAIPGGTYTFEDCLDDDGQGNRDIVIRVCLRIDAAGVHADFDGTARQVAGNVNCPLAVAAAAVFYVFRCLMPPQTPACAGAFRPISLSAPEGCLLNATRPAAVAAGNVETSTRVVDVLLGALAGALPGQIPAASHGSMNNLAMGASGTGAWDYYETIGGGMGAHAQGAGTSGVQTHMTNTLNTPLEVLETHYPLRLLRYAYRQESGGAGEHVGGEGLVREFEFLSAAHFTLLTERRAHRPWGLAGGEAAQAGRNLLDGEVLPAKFESNVQAGQRLRIETPGGGGWGVS